MYVCLGAFRQDIEVQPFLPLSPPPPVTQPVIVHYCFHFFFLIDLSGRDVKPNCCAVI